LTLCSTAGNCQIPAPVISIPGVAVTGSPAIGPTALRLPRNVRRFVRFLQTVPSGGGTGGNASITYSVTLCPQ
jgi:hypothetical protein